MIKTCTICGKEFEVTSDDKHWLKAMYLYNDGENLAPHNVWLIDKVENEARRNEKKETK